MKGGIEDELLEGGWLHAPAASSALRVLGKALRDYSDRGLTTAQFEKDYGCQMKKDDLGNITGVDFQNASAESAFVLKYSK